MTRSKTKSNSSVRPAKTLKSRAKKGAPPASRTSRSASKHARVLGMLHSKRDATIAAMVQVTDWQPHSVRGFLAGVVKKKLGLNLVSEKTKSVRVYRVVVAKPRPTSRPETMTEPTHA